MTIVSIGWGVGGDEYYKNLFYGCEGRIEKICPKDRRLAARGLPSDDKR